MKKKKTRKKYEIVIPAGYDYADMLEMDDSMFEGEKPALEEEVRLHFERKQDERIREGGQ